MRSTVTFICNAIYLLSEGNLIRPNIIKLFIDLLTHLFQSDRNSEIIRSNFIVTNICKHISQSIYNKFYFVVVMRKLVIFRRNHGIFSLENSHYKAYSIIFFGIELKDIIRAHF